MGPSKTKKALSQWRKLSVVSWIGEDIASDISDHELMYKLCKNSYNSIKKKKTN